MRRLCGLRSKRGDILVSEPLVVASCKLTTGGALTLRTANGPHAFRIAGVYREYGNDRGTVLMSRDVYRRFWQDDAVTAMGLYLRPGESVAAVRDAIRAATRERQSLAMTSNADVRAHLHAPSSSARS